MAARKRTCICFRGGGTRSHASLRHSVLQAIVFGYSYRMLSVNRYVSPVHFIYLCFISKNATVNIYLLFLSKGDFTKAFKCAIDFIKAVEFYDSDWLKVAAGVPYFVEMVLNLLWHMERYDFLERMLQVTQKWTTVCPFMSQLWEKSLARLKQVGFASEDAFRGQQQDNAWSSDRKPPFQEQREATSGGVMGNKSKHSPFGMTVWDARENNRKRKLGDAFPPQSRETSPVTSPPEIGREEDYRSTIRRPRVKKPSVWNSDAHISLLHDCLDYQTNFRKYFWPFSPLHPAGKQSISPSSRSSITRLIFSKIVLDDSNVTYFFSTDAGAEEKSPLALSFYVCLARGNFISLLKMCFYLN